MGKTAPDHLTGAASWDGRIPFALDTGEITFATAAQTRIRMITAPCDAYIVAAQMKTLASSTGSSSKFNIGKNATASALLTFLGNANLASTVVNLMSASTWVAAASKIVRRGDQIYVTAKASTAVGRFAIRLQFMPLN